MEAVNVRMRRQMYRKDERMYRKKAMKWNPLISAGRLPGRPRKTWISTVARESKIIVIL